MPELVGTQLLGVTLCISAPDVTEDEDDREGTEMGVRVVGVRDKGVLVERLVQEGAKLVLLDVTMFEIRVGEVEMLLDACGEVKVLGLSVGLERGWDEVLGVLGKKERGFEALEIVGVPGEAMVEKIKAYDGESQLKKEELEKVSMACKRLKSLKVSILRTKIEQWVKEGDVWTKV